MESQNKDKNTLRVSSLYKSFGKKSVVKGVDFSMQTGEVLGLLGPNGAAFCFWLGGIFLLRLA